MLRLAFSLCLLVLSVHAADRNARTPGGNDVQFLGRSAQMRVARGKLDAQIKWDKVEEIDQQGRVVVAVNNFASQDFDWQPPVTFAVGNVNTTQVSLVATLSVGSGSSFQGTCSFNITSNIYSRDVVVSNGNSTVSVPRDSIKFTISINRWPFKSASNSLRFGASLLTSHKPQNFNSSRKSGFERRVQFGPAILDSANTAIVDGKETAVNTTVVSFSRSLLELNWVFPNFQKTLVYDPVLAVNADYPASTSASASLTVTMSVLLASLLAVLAALF